MKATTRDHVPIISVTKQMERGNDSGDRPATEIEVTPEMVQAGVIAFDAYLAASSDFVVAAVYTAMHETALRLAPQRAAGNFHPPEERIG